eukprot:TRINITY_DN2996_c0_g1_i12.p1 TRINITY_DN2996_c0_g1~~TRINITY_DN2996_c0_g1_i12.p1  ORF type:complete len:1167 (-),score=158.65 TRINITY_DN2996_c0_g1_i12:114-3614(-)
MLCLICSYSVILIRLTDESTRCTLHTPALHLLRPSESVVFALSGRLIASLTRDVLVIGKERSVEIWREALSEDEYMYDGDLVFIGRWPLQESISAGSIVHNTSTRDGDALCIATRNANLLVVEFSGVSPIDMITLAVHDFSSSEKDGYFVREVGALISTCQVGSQSHGVICFWSGVFQIFKIIKQQGTAPVIGIELWSLECNLQHHPPFQNIRIIDVSVDNLNPSGELMAYVLSSTADGLGVPKTRLDYISLSQSGQLEGPWRLYNLAPLTSRIIRRSAPSRGVVLLSSIGFTSISEDGKSCLLEKHGEHVSWVRLNDEAYLVSDRLGGITLLSIRGQGTNPQMSFQQLRVPQRTPTNSIMCVFGTNRLVYVSGYSGNAMVLKIETANSLSREVSASILISEFASGLSPVMDVKCEDLHGDGQSTIMIASGFGHESSLNIGRYSFKLQTVINDDLDLLSVTSIGRFKLAASDVYDSYLAMSCDLSSQAAILRLDPDEGLKQTTIKGLSPATSILISNLGSHIVQVTADEVSIVDQSVGKIGQWTPPDARNKITHAQLYGNEIILAQESTLIILRISSSFSLELVQLVQHQHQISSISNVCSTTQGAQIAVSFWVSNEVRLLHMNGCKPISAWTLPSTASAMYLHKVDQTSSVLLAGLYSGRLLQRVVGPRNPDQKETTYIVGDLPVRLYQYEQAGVSRLFVFSDRCSVIDFNSSLETPIRSTPIHGLENAKAISPFHTAQMPHAFAIVTQNGKFASGQISDSQSLNFTKHPISGRMRSFVYDTATRTIVGLLEISRDRGALKVWDYPQMTENFCMNFDTNHRGFHLQKMHHNEFPNGSIFLLVSSIYDPIESARGVVSLFYLVTDEREKGRGKKFELQLMGSFIHQNQILSAIPIHGGHIVVSAKDAIFVLKVQLEMMHEKHHQATFDQIASIDKSSAVPMAKLHAPLLDSDITYFTAQRYFGNAIVYRYVPQKKQIVPIIKDFPSQSICSMLFLDNHSILSADYLHNILSIEFNLPSNNQKSHDGSTDVIDTEQVSSTPRCGFRLTSIISNINKVTLHTTGISQDVVSGHNSPQDVLVLVTREGAVYALQPLPKSTYITLLERQNQIVAAQGRKRGYMNFKPSRIPSVGSPIDVSYILDNLEHLPSHLRAATQVLIEQHASLSNP